MPETRARASIPVQLVVPGFLLPPERRGRTGAEQVASRVRRELTSLARGLGVPGTVEVALEPASGNTLALSVHGVECRYPRETVSRVWSTCEGRVLTRAPRAVEAGISQHRAGPADVMAGVCREIVMRRPSVLLERPQVSRYVRGTAAAHLDADWVLGALRRVLDARIAIAGRETVIAVLAAAEGRLCRQAAETLIARLRAPEIVVLVHREYLRAITEDADAEVENVVGLARDRLDESLGVAMPALRFAEDRSLHPRALSFKVNDVASLPWIGLEPGSCLVNESVDTLAELGVSAEPAANPVSELDNAIVPLGLRGDVEKFHMRSWTPLEYLGLCLEATLRRHAACLVDTETIRRRLDELGWQGSAYEDFGRRLPAGRLLRVMRALLDEGVSVSDFPGIIEVVTYQHEQFRQAAAQSDPIWSDEADVVADRRDAEAVAAARRRLGRQVAAKVTSDAPGQPMTAAVLDDGLHQMVAAARAVKEPLAPEDADLLIRSVRAALTSWPGSRWPALLTTTEVRGTLRDALAEEFRDLSVVAYEELPADVSIDVAGTIGTRSGS